MDNTKFEALISEVETRNYKYDFEIGDAFKQIAADNELSEIQEEIVKSEFMLFRFMTNYELEQDSKPRFRPVMIYTDGTEFPSQDEITPARLSYYLERAAIVTNNIMKARYLDINYEYNEELDKDTIIDSLIDAYIEASKEEGRGNEKDKIDSLARAFDLGIKHKQTHEAAFEKSKQNLLQVLKQLEADNLRWCIEVLEIIIKQKTFFSDDELRAAKNLADKGVKHYSSLGDSFMILESYLDLKHSLDAIVNADEYDAAQAARENAQLYIEDANSREEVSFIKQMNLLKGEKILRDAGLNKEANEIHAKVEQIGQEPGFDNNFKTFSFEQQIPTEELIKLKDELINHADKAGLIALSQNFMPSWKNSKKSGQEEQYASISDLISSVTYNSDGMPIAKAIGDEKHRKTMRHYEAAIVTCTFFLVVTIKKVLEEGGLTQADIEPQIEKIKDINTDTYETVKHGFEHFFKGNYYEALLVLVPQLEDLLGDLVVSFGMTRYRQKDEDLVEYKTLGPLLTALKKTLGDDLYHFLHYHLIDPSKDPLRNVIGHGKLKKTDKNLEEKAILILQAYMAVLYPLQLRDNEQD